MTVRLVSDGELRRLGREPAGVRADQGSAGKVTQGAAGQYPLCRFDEPTSDIARTTLIDASAPW